jgi:4-hydroxy-tetrahydrodipicolinate reductase
MGDWFTCSRQLLTVAAGGNRMKIALLGKGKTGMQVINLARSNNHDVTVFDKKHPPGVEHLGGHDLVISFLPGTAFTGYIPGLMESGLPVVTGSTGFDWPGGREAFSAELLSRGLTWIHGNNFSPGMRLIHRMSGVIRNAGNLFGDYRINLHEIHHAEKIDAPSGTALAWQQWLGEKIAITSERTGDVPGIHMLSLTTPFEKITIQHEVLDRALFASGAILAAEFLHRQLTQNHPEQSEPQKDRDDTGIDPGLYDFQERS